MDKLDLAETRREIIEAANPVGRPPKGSEETRQNSAELPDSRKTNSKIGGVAGVSRDTVRKEKQGGTGANQHTQRPQNEASAQGKTSGKVGEKSGVSEKTVRRDAEYARAVDALAASSGSLLARGVSSRA